MREAKYIRSRFAFTRRDIRGVSAPLASATKTGVTLRSDLDYSVWNPDTDVSNYKLVEPNDFVIGLRSFQHGISHSEVTGIVSPAYHVLRCAPSLEPRFYKYYFRSSRLISELANITQGIRQGQSIDMDAFDNLLVPVPPRDEQRRIADFLDGEISRLDALAGMVGRALSLLELRRTNHILDEVTRGADAARSTVPLKYVASSVGVGIVITPAKWYVTEGGVTALRGLNVRPGKIDLGDVVQISREGHLEHAKSRLRANDVVVVRTGQAGVAAVVPPELDGSNCIDLVIIRPRPGFNSKYLEIILNSEFTRRFIDENSVGSIQSHLNVGALKQLPVPKRAASEQAETVRVVGLLDSKILSARRLMKRQLDLLAERRQSLITAAVTGQFDVTTGRGADLS